MMKDATPPSSPPIISDPIASARGFPATQRGVTANLEWGGGGRVASPISHPATRGLCTRRASGQVLGSIPVTPRRPAQHSEVSFHFELWGGSRAQPPPLLPTVLTADSKGQLPPLDLPPNCGQPFEHPARDRGKVNRNLERRLVNGEFCWNRLVPAHAQLSTSKATSDQSQTLNCVIPHASAPPPRVKVFRTVCSRSQTRVVFSPV